MIKNEKQKQIEMFEYYCSLGRDRSLEKVYREFKKRGCGVSRTQLKLYSKKFNWVKRAKRFDDEVLKKAQEISQESLAEVKTRQLKIIKAIYSQFIKQLQAGELKATLGDLEKIMNLERKLLGEEENKPLINVNILNQRNLLAETFEGLSEGEKARVQKQLYQLWGQISGQRAIDD